MEEDDYDLLMKIIIVGDSGVGKTNLVNRFTQQTFIDDCKPTVGVEFFSRNMDICGKTIKAQVWDTAGQEKFRAITHAYYRGAVGAMICFDITKEQTFNNVEKWIEELKEYADQNITMMLIGTKSDLESKRVIRIEDGSQKANQHKIAYLETSALKATNVAKAFTVLLEQIYQQIERQGKEYTKRASLRTGQLNTDIIQITPNPNSSKKSQESKKQCC